MRRIAPGLVLALLLALAPASAHAVTVDFESPALADGTTVSNQFAGVTFENGPPLNAPALPAIRTTNARSGAHTLDISQGADELPAPRAVGRFSQQRQSVTVWLRNVTDGSFSTVMELKLYDAGNNEVASTTATVASTNPAYVQLTATSAGTDVLRFQVQSTTPVTAQGQEIRLDDLDFTGVSATPDFSPSSSVTGAIVLPRGKSRSTTIALNRTPTSNGDISFASTGGLPTGVTASFSPNPATGTTDSTLVTLTASPTATAGLATITVTGTPAAGAGAQPRSVQFNFITRPPFTLGSTGPSQISLPPCSSQDVSLNVGREETVDDAISFAAEGSSGRPLGDGWTASFDPATLSGIASATTMRLSRGDTSTNFPGLLLVRATSPSLPDSAPVAFDLHDSGMSIDSVSTVGLVTPFIRARAPQQMAPGEPVLITGTGICPGATAEFGNFGTPGRTDNPGSVPLTQVGPATWRAIVPRLATDGPVRVTNPGRADAISTQSVDVQTYRDTNGFNFPNATWTGGVPEWEELFGPEQLRITFDACFPGGCNVVTSALRPDASIYMSAWDAGLRTGNGTCVGFALGSRRILTGDLLGYPRAGQTLWDLPRTDELFRYLRVQHIAQASSEFMNRYLARRLAGFAGTITSDSFRRDVEERLRAGRPPLIILANGGSGHAVVAYDVESRPGGGYFLRVYDSNFPVDGTERGASNGPTHVAREQGSRIEITDGHWTFFDLPSLNAANPWRGTMADIVAIGEEEIPVRPTYPVSARGIVTLIFGAGQGAPGSGGGRATQSAAAPRDLVQLGVLDGSGIPAYVGKSGRAHSFDARADSRGRLVASALGDGNAAEISATGPAKGAARVSTLAGGDGVRYETLSPSTALRETLTSRLGSGETHLAQVSTRSFLGGGDELALDRPGKTLSFRHEGKPATVTLELSSSGGRAAPSRFRGTLALKPGDRVTATPGWTNLAGSLRVTIRGRKGTRRVSVANSVRPGLVVRTVKATPKRSGSRVLVTISAGLTGATSGGTETVAASVTRGRKVVGRGSRVLTGGKVRRSTRLTLSIPVTGKAGGLRVQATVTALSGKPLPASSSLKTTAPV
jgi:hypothetical protein